MSTDSPLHEIDDGSLDALARSLQELQNGGTQFVGLFAKSENFRHVRHDQVLARWPVLDEAWAQSIETARTAAVDRTPAAATFGR
ncbi:MAG: hypothetical protein AB7V42_11240 [Thermoleophilia bacterium]